MASQRPADDPKKFNEDSFGQDKDLFDTVMLDEFGFVQVMPAMVRVTIEPTVKGLSHQL